MKVWDPGKHFMQTISSHVLSHAHRFFYSCDSHANQCLPICLGRLSQYIRKIFKKTLKLLSWFKLNIYLLNSLLLNFVKKYDNIYVPFGSILTNIVNSKKTLNGILPTICCLFLWVHMHTCFICVSFAQWRITWLGISCNLRLPKYQGTVLMVLS